VGGANKKARKQPFALGRPFRQDRPISVEVSREVHVRVFVTRLIDVDLKNQTFTAQLQLEALWHEPQLDALAPPACGSWEWDDEETQQRGWFRVKGRDDKFYTPRLYLRNLVAAPPDLRKEWFKIRNERSGTLVSFRMELQGTFQEQMELISYPYDHQLLTVEVQACREFADGAGRVISDEKGTSTRLRQNLSGSAMSQVNTAGFILSSEYQLMPQLKFEERVTHRDESSSRCQYSLLRVSMRVRRRPGFVHFNVALPIFLITSCTFASYVVEDKEFADRCAINLAVLLAQVAFKFIIADKLPRISYATPVDYYVLMGLIMVALVVLHQSLLHLDALREDDEDVSLTGRRGFLAWIFLHALAVVVGVVYAVLPQRKVPQGDSRRARALWLGPLNPKVVKGSDPDEAEAIAKAVLSVIGCRSSEVEHCLVWQPGDAMKKLRGTDTKLCERFASASRMAKRVLERGASVSSMLPLAGRSSSVNEAGWAESRAPAGAARGGGSDGDGEARHAPFALLVFKDEELADSAAWLFNDARNASETTGPAGNGDEHLAGGNRARAAAEPSEDHYASLRDKYGRVNKNGKHQPVKLEQLYPDWNRLVDETCELARPRNASRQHGGGVPQGAGQAKGGASAISSAAREHQAAGRHNAGAGNANRTTASTVKANRATRAAARQGSTAAVANFNGNNGVPAATATTAATAGGGASGAASTTGGAQPSWLKGIGRGPDGSSQHRSMRMA